MQFPLLNYNRSYTFTISLSITLFLVGTLLLLNSIRINILNHFSSFLEIILLIVSSLIIISSIGLLVLSLSRWSEDEALSTKLKTRKLANEAILLKEILGSNVSLNEEVNKKRIESVEEIWKSLLDVRKTDCISQAICFYELLLPEEYNDPKSKKLITDLSISDLTRIITPLKDKNEKYRLYISNKLWVLATSYNAFLGRITLLLILGRDKDKIVAWNTDDAVNQLLKMALEDEYDELSKRLEPMNIRAVCGLMENKILVEIWEILSGNLGRSITSKQAIELNEIFKKINKT